MEKDLDYNSPSSIKSFLGVLGFSMQKKFGQNFLINGFARKKIADALEIFDGMSVWEIGPGLGAMTREILDRGARVTAFEIDRGFVAALEGLFAADIKTGRLSIKAGDALKLWRAAIDEEGAPDRFFGNLPYNIASTLIALTIEKGARFKRMVVTVQKEMAERMTASPRTKNYSSFSVLCQWAYDIKAVMDLGGGNFWPRPSVSSRALVLRPREDFPRCADKSLFMRMERALFASRRKTLRNNLSRFLASDEKARAALDAAGVPFDARAESLDVDSLLLLCERVNDVILEK